MKVSNGVIWNWFKCEHDGVVLELELELVDGSWA